jgi:hypothetical protein
MVVCPEEAEPVAELPGLAGKFVTPEPAQLARSHDHEDVPGVGKQLQDVVHDEGRIVGHRNGGLLVREGGVSQESLVYRSIQHRRIRKHLRAVLSCERSGGAACGDHEIRPGPLGKRGAEKLHQRPLRHLLKSGRVDHEFDEGHGLRGTLVHGNTEHRRELVQDNVPALEGLEQHDPADGRFSPGRKQDRQNGTCTDWNPSRQARHKSTHVELL